MLKLGCLPVIAKSNNISISEKEQDAKDKGLYYNHKERFLIGEYSLAMAQTCSVLEDDCKVADLEIENNFTLVGIFDGHHGHEASRFLKQNIVQIVQEEAEKTQEIISEKLLARAIATADARFLIEVSKKKAHNPYMLVSGSSCLLGAFYGNGKTLYLAGVGNSTAVIGFADNGTGKLKAAPLTTNHDFSNPDVRNVFTAIHSTTHSQILRKYWRMGEWSLLDLLTVSKTVGDAHIKNKEHRIVDRHDRFYYSLKLVKDEVAECPWVDSVATTWTRTILPCDQLVIFASHEFWKHVTHQKAVEMASNGKSIRKGAALQLVKHAVGEACKKLGISIKKWRKLNPEQRRFIHDDMAVMVFFLNKSLIWKTDCYRIKMPWGIYPSLSLPLKMKMKMKYSPADLLHVIMWSFVV